MSFLFPISEIFGDAQECRLMVSRRAARMSTKIALPGQKKISARKAATTCFSIAKNLAVYAESIINIGGNPFVFTALFFFKEKIE